MNFQEVLFAINGLSNVNDITHRQALAHFMYRVASATTEADVKPLKEILLLVDNIFRDLSKGAAVPWLFLTYGAAFKGIDLKALKRFTQIVDEVLSDLRDMDYKIDFKNSFR